MLSKLKEVEVQHSKKIADLEKLTAQDFDITNTNQMATLKNYIDRFELSVNKIYLFRAMLGSYAGSWGLSFLSYFYIPLVDYPERILSWCLIRVFILSQLDGTNFNEQLLEMKVIYNWCLKNGEEHYKPSIDNTKKLEHPEIARLITLLAPLCDVEFMIAWKKVAHNQKGYESSWTSNLYSGASMLSSGISTGISLGVSLWKKDFSQFNKPSEEAIKVQELKTAVETHGLNLDFVTSSKQAIQYFALSPSFRGIVAKSAILTAQSLAEQYLPDNLTVTKKGLGFG